MAEKDDVVIVEIRRHPQKHAECIIEPRTFVARGGTVVDFRFKESKSLGALIKFSKRTPFDAVEFAPGRKTVETNASPGEYEYFVRWALEGGGMGNGTGIVEGG